MKAIIISIIIVSLITCASIVIPIAVIQSRQTFPSTQACSPYTWNKTATTMTSSPPQAPGNLAFDSANQLYITDGESSVIRRFDLSLNTLTSIAGDTTGPGDGATALDTPIDVYVTRSGDIYVLDCNNNRIQKFPSSTSTGTSGTTIAGTGEAGTDLTLLNYPTGFAFDSTETNIFVADYLNHRIVRFSTSSSSGTAGTLVAGTGVRGDSLNQLNAPYSVAYENSTGYLYISNSGAYTIMKWLPGASSGTVVAGILGTSGSSLTLLSAPSVIKLDQNENLYVIDNNRIMLFCKGNGNGVTIAGQASDGGDAADALNGPIGLAFDSSMNLFVSDSNNDRIQKFTRL